MKCFAVRIEGVDPGLLMHKFSATTEAELAPGKVKKSQKRILSAEEEAEEAAYRLNGPESELCQPAEHVYQAMCKTASQFQIKGRGKKTYKDAAKGNLAIEPEYIPHGQTEYRIDTRPVRIQRSRILRSRPLLSSWALEFTIRVLDEDELPDQIVNAILVKAGQTTGIGDYRPRFGRFMVTQFEEVG